MFINKPSNAEKRYLFAQRRDNGETRVHTKWGTYFFRSARFTRHITLFRVIKNSRLARDRADGSVVESSKIISRRPISADYCSFLGGIGTTEAYDSLPVLYTRGWSDASVESTAIFEPLVTGWSCGASFFSPRPGWWGDVSVGNVTVSTERNRLPLISGVGNGGRRG